MPRLRFIELEGENVLSYQHFKVPLANQGMVLLQGPNGSGKSSLPTTLDNCIYSTTARGLKYKDLINVHSDSKNFHSLTKFELDGIEYVVESFRDHDDEGTDLRVFRAGQLISKHMSKEIIKEYIPQLIGYDRTTFLSTIYLSQEHHHILVEGTPKEKERYIMWLFGLNTYEDLVDRAKRKRNALSNELQDEARLKEEIADIEARIKAIPTDLQLDSKITNLEEERRSLKAEISVLENRLAELADLKSKLEMRDDLTSQLQGLDFESPPTSSDIKDKQQLVDDLGEKVSDLKTKTSIARKSEQIKEELASYREARPVKDIQQDLEKARMKKTMLLKVTLPGSEKAYKIRKKLARLQEPAKDIGYYEDRLEETNKEVRKLERRVGELHHQLKKGICPTCKRPWDLTEEEMRTLEAQLETARESLDQSNKKKHLAQSAFEAASKYLKLNDDLEGLPKEDPQDIEIEVKHLTSDVKGHTADLTIAERRRDLEARIESAPSESVEVLEKRLLNSRDKLKESRRDLKTASKAKDLLDQIAKMPDGDIADTKAKLKQTKKSLEDNREALEKAIKRLSTAKANRIELKKLKKELRAKQEEIRGSFQARKDSRIWTTVGEGFNYLLRRRERELLEKLTNRIPAYMRPMFGKDKLKAELCKEEGGIDLRLVVRGKELPRKGISPGQRSKLGLASVFALRDLYDSGANLLILDEPLAGVDEEGSRGLTDILKELQKKIETIVLISHDADIRGLTFNHVWTTTISNGVSQLDIQ